MAKRERLTIEGVKLANFIDTLLEWERISKERWEFKNWKRSPIERENRRESIVFGNCLGTVMAYLGRRKVVALMNEARAAKGESAR